MRLSFHVHGVMWLLTGITGQNCGDHPHTVKPRIPRILPSQESQDEPGNYPLNLEVHWFFYQQFQLSHSKYPYLISLESHEILVGWNFRFPNPMGPIIPSKPGSITYNWLVVYLPLWKIWVRQLGWLFLVYGQKMFQTTNQMVY
jgi:hypothetical protein